jgi:hypothetical protein
MLEWVGRYGIVDAFYLDAAAMSSALRPLRRVIASSRRATGGGSRGVRRPGRPLPELGWEDEEVSRFARKARMVTIRRVHRRMTNALKRLFEHRFRVTRGLRGPGQFDVLVYDYDGTGRDLLLEVKSLVDQNAVRLAVGQLLDYRRHIDNRTAADLAVMLPSEPPPVIREFLKDVSIRTLWFADTSFTRIVGDWECP